MPGKVWNVLGDLGGSEARGRDDDSERPHREIVLMFDEANDAF